MSRIFKPAVVIFVLGVFAKVDLHLSNTSVLGHCVWMYLYTAQLVMMMLGIWLL